MTTTSITKNIVANSVATDVCAEMKDGEGKAGREIDWTEREKPITTQRVTDCITKTDGRRKSEQREKWRREGQTARIELSEETMTT